MLGHTLCVYNELCDVLLTTRSPLLFELLWNPELILSEDKSQQVLALFSKQFLSLLKEHNSRNNSLRQLLVGIFLFTAQMKNYFYKFFTRMKLWPFWVRPEMHLGHSPVSLIVTCGDLGKELGEYCDIFCTYFPYLWLGIFVARRLDLFLFSESSRNLSSVHFHMDF